MWPNTLKLNIPYALAITVAILRVFQGSFDPPLWAQVYKAFAHIYVGYCYMGWVSYRHIAKRDFPGVPDEWLVASAEGELWWQWRCLALYLTAWEIICFTVGKLGLI